MFQPILTGPSGTVKAKYVVGFVDGIRVCAEHYLYIWDDVNSVATYWDIENDVDVTADITWVTGFTGSVLAQEGGEGGPTSWFYMNGAYNADNTIDIYVTEETEEYIEHHETVVPSSAWVGDDEGIIFCSKGDPTIGEATVIVTGDLQKRWRHYFPEGDRLQECYVTEIVRTSYYSVHPTKKHSLIYIVSSDGGVNGKAIGITSEYQAVQTVGYTGEIASITLLGCVTTDVLETEKIMKIIEQDISGGLASSVSIITTLVTLEENNQPNWADVQPKFRGGQISKFVEYPNMSFWIIVAFSYKAADLTTDKFYVAKYSFEVDEADQITNIQPQGRLPNLETVLESYSGYASQFIDPVRGLFQGA